MAPFPDVPKTLRVAVSVVDDQARQLVSRFYISFTGSNPTAAQLNTFCTSVSSAWNTDLAALHANVLTLDEVTAVDLTSNIGAEGSSVATHAGTRGSAILPASIAFVVSYEILRRYRGGHPRGYWPFGVEGDLASEGTWLGTTVTAVEAAFIAFMAAVEAAGWSGAGTLTHSNVSFFEGFEAVENPVTHRYRNIPQLRIPPLIDTVSSYIARATIGSQRRRLRV